jgi:hypothetical protein
LNTTEASRQKYIVPQMHSLAPQVPQRSSPFS